MRGNECQTSFKIHDTVEVDATTTEEFSVFNVSLVTMLANDGTDEVYVNFDMTTHVDKGKMTLKPGDQLFDIPRKCERVYFRSKTGAQPIRIWGLR